MVRVERGPVFFLVFFFYVLVIVLENSCGAHHMASDEIMATVFFNSFKSLKPRMLRLLLTEFSKSFHFVQIVLYELENGILWFRFI